MRLASKINRLALISAVVLTLLLGLSTAWMINQFAEQQARDEGYAIIAMAEVGLRHAMSEGDKAHVSKEIRNLFKGFGEIPQLIEMRVLRGESVIRQYCERAENAPDEDVEKQMLKTGKTSETIQVNEDGTRVFHYNGPILASASGALNCMQCHDATEGEVLGGLSVQVDMSNAEQASKTAIYRTILLVLLVGAGFAYAMRRILLPVVGTVGKIGRVFKYAREGDFSGRVAYDSHDEIGDVVGETNHFMESLDQHVGAIGRDVEKLTGAAQRDSRHDPMQHIANVVHNLTSAVRFKEEIEADRNLEEVYAHLARFLKNGLKINRFSLYEVRASENSNVVVATEGLPEGVESWCFAAAEADADACRAKRTIRIVDSSEDDAICPPFCTDKSDACQGLRHICLPVLNSSGDGNILQLVFTEDERSQIEEKVALLQYYLRGAAPEIEAKRLMHNLRETSLRDPLTGMYNRRFLDEFISSLESTVKRRDSKLAVLMCDIDYFKRVNDEHGHASGDRVLATVAGIFNEEVRASDLVVRYGGEEIVVLLMDASEQNAAATAERIRAHIELEAMHDEIGTFNITISIGMAMYPEDHSALSECIKHADGALYLAKDSGRNRVIRYDQDVA
ncbi:MAG: diguanylate cyclase [Mariprofundaceae bacterium]